VQEVVLKLGDDVSTDMIYPGRFMATQLPAETPQFAFADLPGFNAQLRAGDVRRGSVVLAGRNFGCGSSREQAVSCLKGHGLTVAARSFARIFLQNAVNLGLPIVVAPGIEASPGELLEISAREVLNRKSGVRYPVTPLPASQQAVIAAGGLIPYTRARVLKRADSLAY